MKNLKPSELPVNTVIDVPDHGAFLKVTDGIWEEVYSGCCSSIGRLSDDGRESAYGDKYGMNHTVKADDIFTDFKVLAVPIGFNFNDLELDIHGNFSYRTMTYADGTAAHNCERVNCEF